MPNSMKKLSLIKQMLDSAEKSIASARELLLDMSGVEGVAVSADKEDLRDKLRSLSVSEVDRVVEGVFDGQNMIGADKKIYPVPANYASKSKLVEGDTLKLTIAEDGSFIYKQIGPVERKKVIGTLVKEETGQYKVKARGKSFKVLLASVTYFKAEEGDEVTLVIPEGAEAEWGAVENVIKKAGDIAVSGSALDDDMDDMNDGITIKKTRTRTSKKDDAPASTGLEDFASGPQELQLDLLSTSPKKSSSK